MRWIKSVELFLSSYVTGISRNEFQKFFETYFWKKCFSSDIYRGWPNFFHDILSEARIYLYIYLLYVNQSFNVILSYFNISISAYSLSTDENAIFWRRHSDIPIRTSRISDFHFKICKLILVVFTVLQISLWMWYSELNR